MAPATSAPGRVGVVHQIDVVQQHDDRVAVGKDQAEDLYGLPTHADVAFRLHRHRALFAVLVPPDQRLGQVHVEHGGTVGVAEREYRSSSLDVVQRRHRPGEGLELRPVIDVEATAVFEIVLVTLGHARGLRIR